MSSLARFARAWTSSAAFSRSPPTTYSTGRRSTSSSRGAVHYSIRARACRSWAPAARTPSPPDAARQDARECVRGAAPRRRNIFHVFNVHLLCHCCNLNPMHVVPSARALFPSRPWAAAASRDRSRRDQWNRITKYLGLARRRARALSPSGLGPFAWPRGPAADTARRGGGTRSVNHQRRRRRLDSCGRRCDACAGMLRVYECRRCLAHGVLPHECYLQMQSCLSSFARRQWRFIN